MQVGGLVALVLVLDVDGEVLPVGLHQVVAQGIHIAVLRLLSFRLIPAGLIRDTIVGDETLG